MFVIGGNAPKAEFTDKAMKELKETWASAAEVTHVSPEKLRVDAKVHPC